jgi:hypothetical protein
MEVSSAAYAEAESLECKSHNVIPFHQDSLKVLCDEARVEHPLAVEAVDVGRHLKIWLGSDYID